MHLIRIGLEKGLDVSVYAKPEFDWKKMREIRRKLEENFGLSLFFEKDFSEINIEENKETTEEIDKDILEEIKKGLK